MLDSIMRRLAAAAFVLLCWAVALASSFSFAQQDNSESARQVVNRVVPKYPEMARTMNLKGTVRIDALVAPDGTVKSVEVRGGHPVLAQAAEHAVRKWRWRPVAHETRELIEIKFDPR
jgi:TonB family protein